MPVFVISDIHAFLGKTLDVLSESGFFDSEDSKLILLGDMLDRGKEAKATCEFLVKLFREDRLIFIRGNHEDMIEEALDEIDDGYALDVLTASQHVPCGTVDTLLQLADMTLAEALASPKELVRRVKETDYYRILLPSAIDYYETDKYIFTHAWIPSRLVVCDGAVRYLYREDWREADELDWRRARWHNGIKVGCEHHVLEPGKTIVCGHFSTSYAHCNIEHASPEYGADADYSPYYGYGIIAIDGSVAHSGRLNCIRLDPE